MPSPGAINPKTGKRYDFVDPRQQARDQQAIVGQIELLERQKVALASRERFMPYIKFTSPDPEAPNDVKRSAYKNARHHDAVARVIEEVVAGNIPFLILVMPPRHGKSEQVSRKLPAWYSGKFPSQHIVVATYNDDFASDFGKNVRDIIRSPQHRQVFPGHALKRGGAASDRLETLQGGQLSFVGRGGSLTGRGAHCLAEGTQIESRKGPVAIESVRPGDEVLSYDVERGALVWKAVEAVARRPRARLFRVATSDRRVVEVTSDHRFYAEQRWIEAAELTSGDRLVCAMRRDSAPAGGGDAEARAPWSHALLLLERVLGCGRERAATRSEGLCAVWRAGAEAVVGWHARAWPSVLLASVYGAGAPGGVRSAGSGAHDPLRAVQRDVFAGQLGDAILQPGVRVEGACGTDARGGEPEVEGRRGGEPCKAARDEALPGAAAACYAAGRRALRALLRGGAAGGASHRRGPAEQPGPQSRDGVPPMSRAGALFSAGPGIVASVTDTRRDAPVYDLQVEGTECFFANGVLVHNCLICDDLIKDDKEASSQAIRDQAWNWLTRVAFSRRMGKKLVILTFTRWHADDPIGRLTDPENDHYNEKLARKIKIISLPALAEGDDPLGREVGEPLWPDGPDKFNIEYLEEMQAVDPLGFAALYQGRPSVADGTLFRRESLRTYKPEDLPADLRVYAASDHAVGLKQRNDPSCLLKVGVDRNNDIYLLECDWRRMASDVAAEAMLTMGGTGKNKPLVWWAEAGHISKSIGPFLRKRMLETGHYINLREITPASDKVQRAQSIAARAAMGKVLFPVNAVWTERAINELLAFPNARHDDFVDALAYIGLGLQSQFGPAEKSKKNAEPKFGTLDWVKQQDKWFEAQKRASSAGGF